MANLE
jgi:tetratricopeptide (TPR) repeat protein